MPPAVNNSTDLLSTHRSLLTRLKRADDQEGWQRFFDTYWRLIYGVARKAGLTDAEAQDAVQEAVITVSRQISRFQYDPERCSFKTWLLMITRQRIARQFAKRQPGARRRAVFSKLRLRIPAASRGPRSLANRPDKANDWFEPDPTARSGRRAANLICPVGWSVWKAAQPRSRRCFGGVG